jgi:peptidoglycan/LPS O-acetylase OafA/YrhL
MTDIRSAALEIVSQPQESQKISEPKRYNYIDSLRGIAILMVLLVHNSFMAQEQIYFPKTVAKFIYDGRFGVQLFFIVSAFTLMLSKQSRTNEVRSTQNYFIRRFFRIAPMYYTAIVYYALQNFIHSNFLTSGAPKPFDALSLVANVFFVHGFAPGWINSCVPGGWSIAVEMSFYVVLPIIVYYINDINKSVIFLLLSIVLATVLNRLLTSSSIDSNQFLYYYFPNQLPIFVLGITSYFIYKGSYKSMNGYSLISIAFAIFYYCYFSSTVQDHFLYSLIFFFLLLSQSKNTMLLLSNRVATYLGKISYSMYLTHFAILYWMDYFGITVVIKVSNYATAMMNFGLRYIVLVFLTAIISSFSYKFIEIKGQEIGKRLIMKLV